MLTKPSFSEPDKFLAYLPDENLDQFYAQYRADKNIVGIYYHYLSPNGLEGITSIADQVEELVISQLEPNESLQPLKALKNLKRIVLPDMNLSDNLDLSWFPLLERIAGNIADPQISNLKTSGIKEIACRFISKNKINTFADLNLPVSLQKIEFYDFPILSFEGISQLKHLKSAAFVKLNSAHNFDDIANCKQLENLYFSKVKYLNADNFPINNSLISLIIEQKEINSIGFIHKLTNLKFLNLGKTIIVDGDSTPLSNRTWAYLYAKAIKA